MLYTKGILITNISYIIPCFNNRVLHEHEVYKNSTNNNPCYPEQMQKEPLNNKKNAEFQVW